MLRNIIKKYYQRKSILDPTQNYSHIAQELVSNYKDKKVLNIGAGEDRLGENVISLDLYHKADIKADALVLPFKNESFDAVLCIAVLEHLKEPKQAISEMWRVLKPEGKVYVEAPFLQPFHASPHDYFRTTLIGLEYWMQKFNRIDSGVCVGPGSSVAWIGIEYIRLWFERLPLVGLLAEILIRVTFLPLKFLDRYLINKKQASSSASAFYFYGKK